MLISPSPPPRSKPATKITSTLKKEYEAAENAKKNKEYAQCRKLAVLGRDLCENSKQKAKFLLLLSYSLLMLGQTKQAFGQYRQIFNIASKNRLEDNFLKSLIPTAKKLAHAKDFEHAINLCNILAKLKPLPEVLEIRGHIYNQLGRSKQLNDPSALNNLLQAHADYKVAESTSEIKSLKSTIKKRLVLIENEKNILELNVYKAIRKTWIALKNSDKNREKEAKLLERLQRAYRIAFEDYSLDADANIIIGEHVKEFRETIQSVQKIFCDHLVVKYDKEDLAALNKTLSEKGVQERLLATKPRVHKNFLNLIEQLLQGRDIFK